MAQDYNLPKLQKKVKKELDDERFRHTLGVMYTSAALAMCYEEDICKAQVAGLLHDCAKCVPNERKLKLCDKYHIQVNEVERKAPSLLHAKLGAYFAEHEYGISDPDILGAIRWHTTGKPDMRPLEKIVFMADYIEPMRFKAANLQQIRALCFSDLDKAVYLTLHDTLQYLRERGSGHIDEMTEAAYHYYRDKLEEEE